MNKLLLAPAAALALVSCGPKPEAPTVIVPVSANCTIGDIKHSITFNGNIGKFTYSLSRDGGSRSTSITASGRDDFQAIGPADKIPDAPAAKGSVKVDQSDFNLKDRTDYFRWKAAVAAAKIENKKNAESIRAQAVARKSMSRNQKIDIAISDFKGACGKNPVNGDVGLVASKAQAFKPPQPKG